ncbi:MAG TPA: hypothetical protein VIC57_01680 [Candidatus Dormibacteraeota bacterium]|jgi:hypothetical protein
MFDIKTREVPEQLVVTEQRTVTQRELEEWLPGAMGRVHREAGGFGGVRGSSSMPWLLREGRPDEPVFIVFYEGNPNEGPVPVECCAPVDPAQEESADVPMRRVPAHREAYIRMRKEQIVPETLGSAYMAVERWIGEQGLEVAAAPREVYYTDFFGAAPTDDVFDVAFPYR